MMARQKIVRLFIVLAVFALETPAALAAAAANQWQTHATIRAAAQSYMDAFIQNQHAGRSEVRLGSLDPRLRLKSCKQPLEASLPQGGRTIGNTTVSVRCPDEGGWSIYVSARVNVYGPVLITRQPLARGATVIDSDLELVERNLATLPHGYYSDSTPVAGMLAKRTIAAAAVITPQMLQAPKLIKRGERVTLVAETGPLKVRMTGHAMSDGVSGQLIGVRADGSKRVVDGIVVSRGVVKVTL